MKPSAARHTSRRCIAYAAAVLLAATAIGAEPPPIRALLVTGGCCHDYAGQTKILTEEIAKRIRIDWTVVRGGKGRDEKLSLYEKRDWAAGYDVVVHNECFGSVDDVAFVENIARAHFEGTAAVVIHCSMHSYRAAATDEWRKVLGVTSRSHEKHRPVTVEVLDRDHPILAGFPDRWETPNGELYKIEKLWPGATPLAKAFGVDTQKDHVVIWTNTYGKGRTFGTTLGHHNETMVQDEYLGMLTRGLLWACGKLGEDGEPEEGYAAGAAAAEQKPVKVKVLLIGHRPDHPHGTHMYMHECRLLAKCLEQTAGVEAVVSDGWPRDAAVLDGVRGIVLYSSPGGDIVLGGPHRAAFEALVADGVGYTAIHWATGDRDLERGPAYMKVLGGWFDTSFGGLKTTTRPLIQAAPDHPVCRGWKPYELHEEFYLDLKFDPGAKPVIQVEVEGKVQTVAWTLERPGGGRSFGTTLGHFHENFTIEPFRRALTNGILWTAGLEVPAAGAPCAIGKAEIDLPPPPR